MQNIHQPQEQKGHYRAENGQADHLTDLASRACIPHTECKNEGRSTNKQQLHTAAVKACKAWQRKNLWWGPQTPDIVQRVLNKILKRVFLRYRAGGGTACKNSCKCFMLQCNIFVYYINTLRVNKFCTWNRNLCPKIWSNCEYRTRTTVLFLKLDRAICCTFGDLLLWCYIQASSHFQTWSV